MRLQDFDYTLPQELIAQSPAPGRDRSRMMVVQRRTGSMRNHVFHEFPEFLRKGDVLVINDSRVIPARLFARKTTGAAVEILLLRSREGAASPRWEALLRPAKRIKAGSTLGFDGGGSVRVLERIDERKWVVEFRTGEPFESFLRRHGQAPLPPYIRREKTDGASPDDLDRYQTVYARHPGSIAAPTAGLHFTEAVLEKIRGHGIPVARVTLHVGYGTFTPVEVDKIEDHRMDEEYYEIGDETAEVINSAQRVVAVGTTSTRVLETIADDRGHIRASTGSTGLYIYPGYRFRRVGALLTNFHLPKSSLFLLACAFAGRDLLFAAYQKAIEDRYRFYSYGDCMFIE
ncbi:MAG TPA: tRNA preQ1(34) S-adenosylmethionine ribosyltransferase-isomerase QueA [Syntrophales bacterium]|nr:tRNA preQ1(34) S-adenosylmethionine ribosyltransferase-isomerase QueA [Syntrophales bacterium]